MQSFLPQAQQAVAASAETASNAIELESSLRSAITSASSVDEMQMLAIRTLKDTEMSLEVCLCLDHVAHLCRRVFPNSADALMQCVTSMVFKTQL